MCHQTTTRPSERTTTRRAHLSGGADLLLPVLFHVKLGAAAHTHHAAHGFAHVASLLPGRKDLRGGQELQQDGVVMMAVMVKHKMSLCADSYLKTLKNIELQKSLKSLHNN